MSAIEKIEALSVKVVHSLAAQHRPDLALETVYRWRTALASGAGVADAIKKILIEATRETAQPIVWADFDPAKVGSADA